MTPLISAFFIILFIQLFFFALAYLLKTDKFTDITYSATFVIVVIYKLLTVSSVTFPQIVLTVLITLWGIRLGAYLFTRISKIKKDNRFDDIRGNFFKFLGFWLLQALTIWIVLIPAILFLSQITDPKFYTISIVSIPIFLLALSIETIADWQKFIFKLDPKNKGKWIDTGIWHYSRHPNYFGEILVWWSLFIYITPYISGLQYLSIIGPLFISFMLLFVSGIPLLEKKNDQRYKDNSAYQKYKNSTSLLIPLPKKKI